MESDNNRDENKNRDNETNDWTERENEILNNSIKKIYQEMWTNQYIYDNFSNKKATLDTTNIFLSASQSVAMSIKTVINTIPYMDIVLLIISSIITLFSGYTKANALNTQTYDKIKETIGNQQSILVDLIVTNKTDPSLRENGKKYIMMKTKQIEMIPNNQIPITEKMTALEKYNQYLELTQKNMRNIQQNNKQINNQNNSFASFIEKNIDIVINK